MKVTVNGRRLEAAPGQTVLDAARAAGIYIPALCYHPKTGKAGRCRACVVEVEGLRGLKESCALPVKDGMVVRTDTPKVHGDPAHGRRAPARRGPPQLHLLPGQRRLRAAGHGLPPGHRAAGLPDRVRAAARSTSRRRASCAIPTSASSAAAACAACQNVVVNEVLAFGYRGSHAKVVCDDDVPMGDSTCVQCGECVQVCPVGALVLKQPTRAQDPAAARRRRPRSPARTAASAARSTCTPRTTGTPSPWPTRASGSASPTRACCASRAASASTSSTRRTACARRSSARTASWSRRAGTRRSTSWPSGCKAIKDAARRRRDRLLHLGQGDERGELRAERFARAVIGTNNIDHCARL